MLRKTVLFLATFTCIVGNQFFNCHDDPSYEPEEGPLNVLQFTWLGALQYIHVKKGNPHYFRVPRVILITTQFVLSTAEDAAQVPEGYALGNVAFGDYERDEKECRVTIDQIAQGASCEPAVLLMPIADVLLHPEYKHFGASNSVALMKLIMHIQSKYMVPACLPFRDYIMRTDGRQSTEKFNHLDFSSEVPRDFAEEDKEITKLSLLPRELCYLYDEVENSTKFEKDRMACTTGCGLRSGAPSLVHEHTGHWTIVALAMGGSPCPDPLRPRRPPAPPRHLLLLPYVPWITTAISGKAEGGIDDDDPFGFMIPRASTVTSMGSAWVGHWWMGGISCYDRGDAALELFRFYHEIFQIKPTGTAALTYYLEIEAGPKVNIQCVKVGMPHQLGQPRVWELGTTAVKVRIPLLRFNYLYKFEIEAYGANIKEPTSDENEKAK